MKMKKLVSLCISALLCLTLSIPVSAAGTAPEQKVSAAAEERNAVLLSTNYFTGSTVRMNSLNGASSTISTISSGSVLGSNPQVTSVTLNVTVSSGSSAFKLYVESPDGYWDYQNVSRSGAVKFTSFRGIDPSGKWKVYIVTSGRVSTATARMTVNYQY